MKISIPCLRLSSSGVTDTRVKMFHISLSDTQKGPPIAWAAWCCHLKTARERVKEATISTTKFAWCIELIIGIDTSYLKWSQEKQKGFYGIQFQSSFQIGERSFKRKKKWSRQLFLLTYFCYQGNYFIFLQKKKKKKEKKRQLFHLIKKSL